MGKEYRIQKYKSTEMMKYSSCTEMEEVGCTEMEVVPSAKVDYNDAIIIMKILKKQILSEHDSIERLKKEIEIYENMFQQLKTPSLFDGMEKYIE